MKFKSIQQIVKSAKKKKKSQTTIEFIILFAAVLFFFVSLFAVIQLNIEKKNIEKERVIAQNIALDIQNEISLAAESSEGYYREFEIPSNILGKDYEADIVGDRIYIRMGENVGVSYKVFEISSQSGALIQGKNIIEKKGGEVHLNNL